MKEKTKLFVHRLIWLSITLLFLFVPIIGNAVQPQLEIVDEHVYIDEYYSAINRTSLEIEIIFNRNINSGYATIAFYDSNDNFLETKRIYLYAYNEKTTENTYTTINGKAEKYDIISFEFEPTPILYGFLYVIYIPIIFLIGSLLLSYKEYEYKDKKISVYAGWFHHTLRIDEKKFDEHNTLTFFTPIKLSTKLNDETKVEATITLTNRISLKVNDKLLTAQKNKIINN